ncbi:hypothetical protein G4945_15225 [Anaerostipes hadrus]|nr:hypothetical protein [Anaerostipes hadrus]NSH13040.1 hypothetical protein [Anaerostipes hadrus]NSH21870.1 hypothetical protein [Anaerostipes hadrus]NSH36208.1 hypothetical protein [Anaerostipes hadrus]NSH56571.1 hypothetical protein [Anaerostipes hadrus]
MERIYSARIIRREDQVVQGIYVKEFFMFCGIYVSEFIEEYDKISDDQDFVDFNIIMNEKTYDSDKNSDELTAKYTIYMNEKDKTELDLSSRDKRVTYGKSIRSYILQIPEILKWNEAWMKDFTRLYDTFVDLDYAYNDYLTHVYVMQFSEDMRLMQLEILNNCLNRIYDPEKEVKGLVHRRFAYFNCARKINGISASMNRRRIFDDEKIMKVVHDMSVTDEKFTMGNVLAGLIGLSKEELNISGEIYMQKALEKEGSNKYSAFIYYALAHYYEVDKHNNVRAWKLYQIMKQIVPKSYRMLFKHASQKFYEKNYIDSWKAFFEIYNMMGKRVNKQWFQPLELEYYYKCARILNKIPQDVSVIIGISPIEEKDLKRIEKEDFKKSKFMKNFIFNDKIQELYLWYFRNKMEKHTIDIIIDDVL